jgi:ABC-type multidrug transport system ATPase subunit
VSEPALVAHEVHKRYGHRRVLLGATFEAHAGQLVAIVGENGSGKSTLLRILAGIEVPDRGSVARRGACGYCPQEPLLYPHLTPEEHFELFGCAYGLPAAFARGRSDALLEQFGLNAHRRTVVQELSGGMRQKVNLAIAVMHDPSHVLLDEPYSGLDVAAYRRLAAWLQGARDAGKCIVLITHMLLDREPFDLVLHLQGGVLRADPS